MQDGCKVHMDSYTTSNGSCFMVTWIIIKNHSLEVGLSQNRETMTHSEHSQPLVHSTLSCPTTRTNRIHWNSMWLRARSHMTSHYTRGSVTIRRDGGGVWGRWPLDKFLLGSHNFMVTALGPCVRWALRLGALLEAAAAQMIGIQADLYNHDCIIRWK